MRGLVGISIVGACAAVTLDLTLDYHCVSNFLGRTKSGRRFVFEPEDGSGRLLATKYNKNDERQKQYQVLADSRTTFQDRSEDDVALLQVNYSDVHSVKLPLQHVTDGVVQRFTFYRKNFGYTTDKHKGKLNFDHFVEQVYRLSHPTISSDANNFVTILVNAGSEDQKRVADQKAEAAKIKKLEDLERYTKMYNRNYKQGIADQKARELKKIADQKAQERKRIADQKARALKKIADQKAQERKRIADQKAQELKKRIEDERKESWIGYYALSKSKYYGMERGNLTRDLVKGKNRAHSYHITQLCKWRKFLVTDQDGDDITIEYKFDSHKLRHKTLDIKYFTKGPKKADLAK